MKMKSILLSMAVVATLLAGCGANNAGNNAANNTTNNAAESKDGATDAVTTASIVDSKEAFEKAISADGTWIIATLNDLEFDKELVLEGTFYNKNDEAQGLYRKIGLYTQDDDRNVIDRFTLTTPKLTIKSENAKIQGGTIVGDVYVEANGFTVTDATIEGNVYFANEEFKSTFKTEKEGKVTGATEVATDAVTTASLVNEEEAFVNAISADGTWIIATLNDLTFDKELVLEGTFYNKNDESKGLYRKIAPYTQDADHKVIDRFTITAPKLTVKSENAKIQGGIFVGDVYVEANGFTVSDATIEGNVYFANEEVKSTFKTEKEGKVTGTTEVK